MIERRLFLPSLGGYRSIAWSIRLFFGKGPFDSASLLVGVSHFVFYYAAK